MRPQALLLVAVLVGVGGLDAHAQSLGRTQPAIRAGDARDRKAFLDTYCVTCHNERRKVSSGNLALDAIDAGDLRENTGLWEKMVRKLRVGAMPPAGARRPPAAEYETFIGALERGLDQAAAAAPDPGRVPVRRLNRLQYTNAIRDLFGVEVDGRSILPADNTGYGFDNIADVLTMSPGLLDRYLVAASKVSRMVVSNGAARPSTTTYSLPYLSLGQDERMDEALPFGSRGGTAIRHYFPADGEYSSKIFLQRSDLAEGYSPRGFDVVTQIDVRLDRQRVRTFAVGGGQPMTGGPDSVKKVLEGPKDTYDAEAGLEVRFAAKKGTHTLGISFDRDAWVAEGLGVSRLPLSNAAYSRGRTSAADVGRIDMGLDKLDIAGPFNPVASASAPSQVFVCSPSAPAEEEPCARRILRGLARRAFRRPVTATDVDALLLFYRRGREGADFDAGMRAAIERMLVDANFLFVLERAPAGTRPGASYRVSDLELATRLALFLWGSIPDAQLLEVAERGQLRSPAVLDRQVQRMIADRRAASFVESFFGQWLMTRNVASHRPDPKVFPQFDENLREAFREETRLFLEDQLRANRPVLDLFTARYSFMNERLARHYGIASVSGSHYRKVALDDDARGGILGHGSVLMTTSYVDRTSVVVRGKWILETLFGVPPPPPPPNVPPIEATNVSGSLRQRMELHRKNPVCATCHSQIDPLGFALENFDGVGMFRTLDGGAAVDASGVLVDGTTFSGPATFRQALLQYRTPLLTNLTERLLVYALGRGLEPIDMPVVRGIIHDSSSHAHTWSALVLAVVKSQPFQMRRAES